MSATKEDLHKAVDQLIQKQRIRLVRDETNRVEWHIVASLWEQLSAATSWRSGAAGTGAFGSRPVISTGAIALSEEIKMFVFKGVEHLLRPPIERVADAVHAADAAWHQVELRKAEYNMARDFDTCKLVTDHEKASYAALLEDTGAQWQAAHQHWEGLNDRAETKAANIIPDSLRALAANAVDPLDFEWWRDVISDWCSQITDQLALNPVRPQYAGGTPCPDCHADTYTTTRRQDRKTEKMRVPALAISWASPDHDGASYQPPEKWVVQEMRCQVCGQRWKRGPALDSLVDLTIRKRGLKDKLLQKLAGMEEAHA